MIQGYCWIENLNEFVDYVMNLFIWDLWANSMNSFNSYVFVYFNDLYNMSLHIFIQNHFFVLRYTCMNSIRSEVNK
jgi:hypothetical protein